MWYSFILFLKMGGFAEYVWPAYGIAFCILFGLLISSLHSQRKILQQLKQEYSSYASDS